MLTFTTVKRFMPPKPIKSATESEAALRIRQLRESRGETQTAFAQALGTQPSAVSKWEAGRNLPQPKIFALLANLAAGEAKQFFQRLAGLFMDESSAVVDGSSLFPHVLVERKRSSAKRDAEPNLVLDQDLLVFAMERADAALKKEGGQLRRPEYAKLVALIYDFCHKAGSRDPDMVEALFETARSAIHIIEPGTRSDEAGQVENSQEDRRHHGHFGTGTK